MSRRVWVAVVVLVAAPAVRADDKPKPAAPDFFDPSKVWQLHLALTAEEYAALQPAGGFPAFGAPPAPAPKKDAAKEATAAAEMHKQLAGVAR